MIELVVRDIPQSEWHALTAGFGGQCLVQSWEYAEAKARIGAWRVERALLADGGQTVGAVHVLIRSLPYGLPGGLAWINRGPLWAGGAEPDPSLLMGMMAAIRDHYAVRRKLYVRLAPPAAEARLSAPMLEAAGFAATGTAGWASAEVDLTQPVETLRKKLRSNWRNTLRKAERAGLAVRSDDGACFDEFAGAYDRFLAARGFSTTVTPLLLGTLRSLLPADERMCAFLVGDENALLGAALIARTGNRAEYLAGFVEEEGRNTGAGQLLLWQAMTVMAERGVTVFDVGGMDPDLTPRGIYDFKDGLGGTPYRLAAEREAGGDGILGRLVRWRVSGARSAA
jgi:peptidoglycan pentaglycine glycine transferase (the first glycine)